MGGSGGLLVQGTLAGLGYDVSLLDLAMVQVPVAVVAMIAAIVYYNVIDRRLTKRRARVIKATGSASYEEGATEAEGAGQGAPADAEKGGDAK